MKKHVAVFVIVAVAMIAIGNIKALAGDVTPTPTPTPVPYTVINNGNSVTDINSIIYYLNDVLTTEQKKIAKYLIGVYNNMYLTARGFYYSDVLTRSDYVDKMVEFGDRFIGNIINTTNLSRWSYNFQYYILAIVNYCGNITMDFNTWLSYNDEEVYIPFTEDALNAWNDWYNDPSNEGVANWSATQTDWVSGTSYTYAFGDYAFYTNEEYLDYSSFILNKSPVVWTNVYNYNQGYDDKIQVCISLQNKPIIDTVFIKRGNAYNEFRYGLYNGSFPSGTLDRMSMLRQTDRGVTKVHTFADSTVSYNTGILSYGSYTSLDTIISYALLGRVFVGSGYTWTNDYKGYYPYITHVVLVDDLYSLSNREDLDNISDLGIVAESRWIETPNGLALWDPRSEVIIQDPLDIFPAILDHTKKEDTNTGSLVSTDLGDFSKKVVNNTVINNYDIVAPGSVINVPVNWLDSEEADYLGYTNNTALPFFVMIGDIFNALGELRIFIIACLILGLAGGVLEKLLL